MPHTQPGHPYLQTHNHASVGMKPCVAIGGTGPSSHMTNMQMNDVGHKSMKPGGGGRFAALAAKTSPAIAAWVGAKKYGQKQMTKWSVAGRKRG